jgi:putative transposase
VFATKDRLPLLLKEKQGIIHQHIIDNCRKKEIFLQAINGYTEHIHCLISLGKQQNIADVAQLIKGESSYWINTNHILPQKLTWQDDYFAVSVSESQVEKVVQYIKNQHIHHAKKSFSEEVEEFLQKYGFQKSDDI